MNVCGVWQYSEGGRHVDGQYDSPRGDHVEPVLLSPPGDRHRPRPVHRSGREAQRGDVDTDALQLGLGGLMENILKCEANGWWIIKNRLSVLKSLTDFFTSISISIECLIGLISVIDSN